jgi:acylphosphatase
MEEKHLEMHAIIKGRVQGVGFRYTTTHFANKLGLKGTVSNLSDGTVEIYAQGPENRLKTLIQNLHEEFDLDPENAASLTFSAVVNDYEDFKIVH